MSRIVGGRPVQKGTWTFVARLEQVSASGTVLTPNWVLTAGHICDANQMSLESLAATFGEFDRSAKSLK